MVVGCARSAECFDVWTLVGVSVGLETPLLLSFSITFTLEAVSKTAFNRDRASIAVEPYLGPVEPIQNEASGDFCFANA